MNILPLSPTSMSCSLTSWESPAAEYVELGVSLDSILVNNPNATYLAYANGDSMENVGIYNGDLLVIDRKPQAQHLDTVIVSLNGAFMCKIIDVRQRLLLSANATTRSPSRPTLIPTPTLTLTSASTLTLGTLS